MSDPTAAVRADHYRHMAQATRELASHADDPEVQSNYLDLAERWSRLADRAEPGLGALRREAAEAEVAH